jgi:MFS transporter, SP family, general alpha glucoside:H+ symporter
MACMIFIVFFAPSLSVLAFGEFMCGVAWGVFQVRVSTPTFHAPDHER